jgi:DNA polymerase delta subunit 2
LIGDKLFLGTSGSPIKDVQKYTSAVPHKGKQSKSDDDGDDETKSDDEKKKECIPLEPIDLLEKSLKWRHLAPTAPDSLLSYPFTEADPSVIDVCPSVYFAGNMDEYSTKLIDSGAGGGKVRLVCVPSFSKTCEAVLLNLATLDTKKVGFYVQDEFMDC